MQSIHVQLSIEERGKKTWVIWIPLKKNWGLGEMITDKSELKEGLDSWPIKVMTQMLKVTRRTVI